MKIVRVLMVTFILASLSQAADSLPGVEPLREENRQLRAQINLLQKENKRLRTEIAALKTAMQTKQQETSKASISESNELRDLVSGPAPLQSGEIPALKGRRVIGSIVIKDIQPDSADPELCRVSGYGLDTRASPVQHTIQFYVRFTLPNGMALRLLKREAFYRLMGTLEDVQNEKGMVTFDLKNVMLTYEKSVPELVPIGPRGGFGGGGFGGGRR